MRSIQSTLFSLIAASSATAHAATQLNLTEGVSPISHDVYHLHMMAFWICVAIGVVVFGVMFYSIFNHRKSKGAVAADFHSHAALEITWTIIPVIILIVMAIPATKVLMNMNNNDKDDLTIKITGYQWKWHYDYLEDNISFFSNLSTTYDQIHNKSPKTAFYLREVDKPLVVPIHKKIRFLITSNDVNHAWWVPDLGVKRDALGGFINEAWTIIDKPGIYRGQCAELCGVNHAFMPIVVIATTEQGYKDWVTKQKGGSTAAEAETNKNWTMDELIKNGEQVYGHICAACHQPGGVGMPPTFPALKGSKVAIGPMPKHVETVMNGVAGSAMQAFKNQLTDVEIASVITYERNAFGNDTKTMVQPVQIKAYRDGKSIEDALKVQPGSVSPVPPTDKPPSGGNKAPTKSGVKDAAHPPASPAEQQQENQVQNPTTVGLQAATPAAQAAAVKPDPVVELKASMVRGEKVYLNTCAACHQPTGLGMPPTFPALKGSPIAIGPIAGHLDRVLNGKPGTAMMAFKDQYNDQDLADVINFERHSWGNNKGPVLSAEDVKAARALPPKQ